MIEFGGVYLLPSQITGFTADPGWLCVVVGARQYTWVGPAAGPLTEKLRRLLGVVPADFDREC